MADELAENFEHIYLEPRCNVDERTWSQNPQGDCDEIGCGEKEVEYIRADIVDGLRSQLAQAQAECYAAEKARNEQSTRVLGQINSAWNEAIEAALELLNSPRDGMDDDLAVITHYIRSLNRQVQQG